MNIWICRELLLFNFKRLDMRFAWIGHPSKKLWPFEFLENFRCSISSVSTFYAPESAMHLNSLDHMNFKTTSVVQFRSCRYITRLNLTSVWKVMTIWISRELPLFNFERVDMWCACIGPPSPKFWPFEFLKSYRCSILGVLICDAPESDIRVKLYDHLNFSRASVVQFRTSRYIMRLNLTSVWNVMTIWICRELLLFNFKRLDMRFAWIGHPSKKLWPFEFPKSFRCSISSVSICDAPESDIRVKSYDHLNFSRASVVHFERLDMWCAWIGQSS